MDKEYTPAVYPNDANSENNRSTSKYRGLQISEDDASLIIKAIFFHKYIKCIYIKFIFNIFFKIFIEIFV